MVAELTGFSNQLGFLFLFFFKLSDAVLMLDEEDVKMPSLCTWCFDCSSLESLHGPPFMRASRALVGTCDSNAD